MHNKDLQLYLSNITYWVEQGEITEEDLESLQVELQALHEGTDWRKKNERSNT